MKKLKYLKPYSNFEVRSGIKPKFDRGDVVTDGQNLKFIKEILSDRDGVYYSVGNIGIRPENEYHLFNRNHELVKKADLKTKYALSNGCHILISDDPDIDVNGEFVKMAMGQKPWPIFFEREWEKEWENGYPEDISAKKGSF